MNAIAVPPPRYTDASRFGRVAVLLGGTSSEREVSLDSGQNVLDALLARGVQAFAVDGVPALVEAIRASKVDRVFNIMHGTGGTGPDDDTITPQEIQAYTQVFEQAAVEGIGVQFSAGDCATSSAARTA